jgi:hypothetical protein
MSYTSTFINPPSGGQDLLNAVANVAKFNASNTFTATQYINALLSVTGQVAVNSGNLLSVFDASNSNHTNINQIPLLQGDNTTTLASSSLNFGLANSQCMSITNPNSSAAISNATSANPGLIIKPSTLDGSNNFVSQFVNYGTGTANGFSFYNGTDASACSAIAYISSSLPATTESSKILATTEWVKSLPTTTSGAYVDLTTTQSVGGSKTFNDDTTVKKALFFNNTLKNISIGTINSFAYTTGNENVAIGDYTGNNITTGVGNVLIGRNSGNGLITASKNTAMGDGAYATNFDNVGNTSFGANSGHNFLFGSNYNACIGYNAGYNGSSSYLGAANCSFIGPNTSTNSQTLIYNKSTCLGSNSQITKDNQIVLGTSTEEVDILGSLVVSKGLTFTNASTSSFTLPYLPVSLILSSGMLAGFPSPISGNSSQYTLTSIAFNTNITGLQISSIIAGSTFDIFITGGTSLHTVSKVLTSAPGSGIVIVNTLSGNTDFVASSVWLVRGKALTSTLLALEFINYT